MNRREFFAAFASVFAAAMMPVRATAQAVQQGWRYLQDPRPLDELIAEYEAAKASKILIVPADDAASKALAATLKWSVTFIGWDSAGNRFQAGSGEIIWNDPLHGTGFITAKHVLYNGVNGPAWSRMAVVTSPDLFTAVANGDWIELDLAKKVEHPSQDLAVLQLTGELLDENGAPIAPVTFYQGVLTENDPVLIGGYGRTGPPSVSNPGEQTGTFDGFRRVARQRFHFFSSSTKAQVPYSPGQPLAGIPGNGDSGGFCAIEQGGYGGEPLLWGIIVAGFGSSTNTITLVEYVGPNQLQWISDIRAAKQVAPGPNLDTDGDGIPDYIELTMESPQLGLHTSAMNRSDGNPL